MAQTNKSIISFSDIRRLLTKIMYINKLFSKNFSKAVTNMGRTKTDNSKRAIFGAKFKTQFEKWQSEGDGRTQESFGEKIHPPASRQSVMKWCRGVNIPTPDRIKQICGIFGLPEDYFDTGNATHEEKYKYESAFVTQIGRDHVEFAKEEGLNLDLVRVLSTMVDFDNDFPLYSPINHWTIDSAGRKVYDRKVNHMDSAPIDIDEDLQFLQFNRDGKRITLHKCDLAYLKEVQDEVVSFVEYLFYKRSKEMEKEVESFNNDLIVSYADSKGNITVEHKAVTEEYIRSHDRFAKYFSEIVPEKKKATQEDWDKLFGRTTKTKDGVVDEAKKDGE